MPHLVLTLKFFTAFSGLDLLAEEHQSFDLEPSQSYFGELFDGFIIFF